MKSTTPGRELSPMKAFSVGIRALLELVAVFDFILKRAQGHAINLSPLCRLPIYSGESLGKEGSLSCGKAALEGRWYPRTEVSALLK